MFNLTLDTLEEMACCIVDNGLERDEACEYIKKVAIESQGEDSAERLEPVTLDAE